jgi:hypothetical protein
MDDATTETASLPSLNGDYTTDHAAMTAYYVAQGQSAANADAMATSYLEYVY